MTGRNKQTHAQILTLQQVKCFRTSLGSSSFNFSITEILRYVMFRVYLLFLNTWHRNNWMAIVQTHRKRYSTVLVNMVQGSPE